MGPATWAEGVSSAEDALRVFEQEPFDLVLSDVVMPEVDCPELVARLRAKGKATRFLLMSGYAGDALDRRCDPVEQLPLIAKPFSPKQLREAVAKVLAATAVGDHGRAAPGAVASAAATSPDLDTADLQVR